MLSLSSSYINDAANHLIGILTNYWKANCDLPYELEGMKGYNLMVNVHLLCEIDLNLKLLSQKTCTKSMFLCCKFWIIVLKAAHPFSALCLAVYLSLVSWSLLGMAFKVNWIFKPRILWFIQLFLLEIHEKILNLVSRSSYAHWIFIWILMLLLHCLDLTRAHCPHLDSNVIFSFNFVAWNVLRSV